jgi:hypothetical protein
MLPSKMLDQSGIKKSILGILAAATALAIAGACIKFSSDILSGAIQAVIVIISLVATSFGIFQSYQQAVRRAQEARKRIERIEVKADKEPEKVKFAWELASAKLEAYFDRNLTQVFSIFVVAIFAMLCRFWICPLGCLACD